MHPSTAIALTFTSIYGPWAAFMVAPYVAMEMWRLSLASVSAASTKQ